MSSNRLSLDVILSTIDKASAPLKKVRGASTKTAQALKGAKDQLRALQRQQDDVSSFKKLKSALRSTSTSLAEAKQRSSQLGAELARHEKAIKPIRQAYDAASAKSKELAASHKGLDRQLRSTRSEYQQATAAWKASKETIGSLNQAIKSSDKPTRQMRDRYKQLTDQQQDNLKTVRRLANETQTLRQTHRSTATALREARDKTRDLKGQLQQTAQPTKALSREFKRAVAASKKLKGAHSSQREQLQQLRSRLNSAGIKTRNLGQHQRRLGQETSKTTAAIERQQDRLKRLGQQQQRAAQRQKRLTAATHAYHQSMGSAMHTGMAGAGIFATASGVGMAAQQIVTPGVTFEESMSRVQALTRLDQDSKALKDLITQARALGASTSFTATDVAEGQGYMAMAGFSPRAIKDAMPGMLNLAKAAGEELAATADIGSNILTSFGLDPAQMGRVGDTLTGAFTGSNTNLQMLGDTMAYVGAVATELGGTLEETAAMTGLLGDAGIQGSRAGTAQVAIYSRIAAPPGMAVEAMKRLDLQTKDALGNLRQMPDLLAEIYRKTRSMGNAERTELLKGLAGEEAVGSLAVLVREAGSGELQARVATLVAARGLSQRTADVMADNTAGDLKELLSAAQDFAIEITNINSGTLRETLSQITELIRRTTAWAKANPELIASISKITVVTGALLLALGTLVLTIAAVMMPFAILRYTLAALGIQGTRLAVGLLGLAKGALPALGGALRLVGQSVLFVGRALLLNPIGLAISAIAVAGLAIIKYWAPIKAFFGGFWQGLTEGLAPFRETLAPLFETLGNVLAPLKPIWDGLTGALANAWAWVSKLFQPFQATGEEIDSATQAGYRFGQWLASLGTSEHWEAIKTGASQFWGWFTGIPNRALTAIAEMIESWDLAGMLKTKWDQALNYMQSLPGRMLDAGKAIADGLGNGIQSQLGELKSGVTDTADSVSGWFTETLGINSPSRVFTQHGQDVLAGLHNGLADNTKTLAPVGDLSKRLKAAGAALAIGSMALPAAAGIPAADLPALQAKAHYQTELPRVDLPALQAKARYQTELPRVDLPALQAKARYQTELPRVDLPALQAKARYQTELPRVDLPALQAKARYQAVPISTLQFDQRPPLAPVQQQAAAPIASGPINITINAAPGMDEQALARLVAREIERATLQHQARARGTLGDLD